MFYVKAFGTIKKYRFLYLMLAPFVLYYMIFKYIPMSGLMIGFMDYFPGRKFFSNEWVGLYYLKEFFTGAFAFRDIRNTLMINLYSLIFAFPLPIILALLLNEIRQNAFKRTVQTITYMPHFISVVVVAGIVLTFVSKDGIINDILNFFGFKAIHFMTEPKWFYTIYILSEIWQHTGWDSIIYLAAIASVSIELYDAAYVDGANRWRQMRHVTLPGIMPTVTILLILKIGSMMSVGFEKVLLLYNPTLYETADVISTYIYRKGLIDLNYSYSTAVGMFNSTINLILLVLANTFSRKFSDTSLW